LRQPGLESDGPARPRLSESDQRMNQAGGIFIAFMGSRFGLIAALFAGVWLFLAARGMAHEFKRADRFKYSSGLWE
jgi:hypothetical protein